MFELDEPPELPEQGEEAPAEKVFRPNNGRGNGVQNAPGDSGWTRGDDVDGHNTGGTTEISGRGGGASDGDGGSSGNGCNGKS